MVPIALGFGLTSPRDLLEKARRDVERLRQVTNWPRSPEQRLAVQDSAFNAAITLWHVTDWIANSSEPEAVAALQTIRTTHPPSKKGADSYDVLSAYVRMDAHMNLCHSLANGAKHFELTFTPALDRGPIFRSEPGIQHGTSTVSSLITGVSVPPAVSPAGPEQPPAGYFAKILVDDRHSVPAVDVFRAALDYWDGFFKTHGL